MSKQFFACVYGGASDRISEEHKSLIQQLGHIIVKEGYSLVYGAGATGCMGAVARGVRESDGYIMGVTPHFMGTIEDIFPCDNTVLVDTMAERKTLMEKHADIYLIAPGGIGTMDEFFQVLTLKYLKRIHTPIVILNLDGFYDSLLVLLDSLINQGAAGEGIRDLYEVVTDIHDEKLLHLFRQIKNSEK